MKEKEKEARETSTHALHMEIERERWEEQKLDRLIQTTMLLKRKSLRALGVHCHLKSPVERLFQ